MNRKSNSKTLPRSVERAATKKITAEATEWDNENYRVGRLIKEARIKKGLTQAQLAKKCKMNSVYISKVENNINAVRICTLQDIIETGLGGNLQVSIKL